MTLIAFALGFGIGLAMGLFLDWILWLLFDERREQ